jgi:hypothetical protein
MPAGYGGARSLKIPLATMKPPGRAVNHGTQRKQLFSHLD